MTGFWEEMTRPGPTEVAVGDTVLRRGSRVRLRPRAGGDIFDLALAGRAAVVEGLDVDDEGEIHVAVTVDDDPGRDLGEARQPGHRFFFSLEEVEPVGEPVAAAPTRRVLVAGIGNIFLGDDAFGVEVARRLAGRELPAGVEVADFGIRGMDLAYALAEYDAAVFVDSAPLGQEPGTLTVLEPEVDDERAAVETHGMDPVNVLRLARQLGSVPPRTLVVACEPEAIVRGDHDEDLVGELSERVRAAVDPAVMLVEELVSDLVNQKANEKGGEVDG